jgi:hypothetical protein
LEQQKKIDDEVENGVRVKFGLKRIGELWEKETVLYYEIKNGPIARQEELVK